MGQNPRASLDTNRTISESASCELKRFTLVNLGPRLHATLAVRTPLFLTRPAVVLTPGRIASTGGRYYTLGLTRPFALPPKERPSSLSRLAQLRKTEEASS